MSTVAEIESAIEKLSPSEVERLRKWLLSRTPPEPTIFEKLQSLVGVADGLPEDMAENHDHYLHGTPKRTRS